MIGKPDPLAPGEQVTPLARYSSDDEAFPCQARMNKQMYYYGKIEARLPCGAVIDKETMTHCLSQVFMMQWWCDMMQEWCHQ